MKRDCHVGLKRLCGLFGKTRHAYYDKEWQVEERTIEYAVVLKLVGEQRKLMKKLGTPKLYRAIKGPLQEHGIKLGRDKLHDLLYSYGLTIKRKRRKVKTTMSRHWLRKYPNRIREMEIRSPEQVWVSDITYLTLKDSFCYLSLITDAYSRKIMGYCLSKDLSHLGCLEALNNALNLRSYPHTKLFHHSDRGVQYCCGEYVGLLRERGIEISMTENGDPYENAIAERLNGILKDEFFLDKEFNSYEEALEEVADGVRIYNEHRLHSSCDYLTPNNAHQQSGELKRRWKTYFKKRTFEEMYNPEQNAGAMSDVDLWKTPEEFPTNPHQ